MRTKLKKIIYHKVGFKYEIENQQNFYKRVKEKKLEKKEPN